MRCCWPPPSARRTESSPPRVLLAQLRQPFLRQNALRQTEKHALLHRSVLPRHLDQVHQLTPRLDGIRFPSQILQDAPLLIVFARHRLQGLLQPFLSSRQRMKQQLVLIQCVRHQQGFQQLPVAMHLLQRHGGKPRLHMPEQRKQATVLSKKEIDQIKAGFRNERRHSHPDVVIVPET